MQVIMGWRVRGGWKVRACGSTWFTVERGVSGG
jgi:hypothetical protein